MLAAVVSFSATLTGIRDVGGWLSDDQALRLWSRAREVEPGGRIVEIGSFQGRSTIVLASAADEGVEVIAIDPHAGNDRGPQEMTGFESEADADHELFHSNLKAAGLEGRVRHVRHFSDVARTELVGEIDLLYVDGAHRYADALGDLRGWGDRVRAGGTLLVHDSFSSIGVTLALLRTMLPQRRWRYVGRSRSLAEFRHEPLTGRERAANVARQIAQLGWFARNVTLKVLITLNLSRADWPY